MVSQLWCALSAVLAGAAAGCAVSAVEPVQARDAAAPASWSALDAAAETDGVSWPPPYVPFDAALRDSGAVATGAGPADASARVDAAPVRDAGSALSPDAAAAPTPDAATCTLDPCVGHCPGTTPCCMPTGRCACMGLLGCGLPPL